MDAVQAILTVQGCKANQGGQASLVRLDGCCEQDQVLRLGQGLGQGLEQGLEFELELVAGKAGIGGLANKAGSFALELEPEMGLELEPELGLCLRSGQGLLVWLEPELELKLGQGQTSALVVSQASRACLAGRTSMV